MKPDDIIEYPGLGEIHINVNARSRRFTFRVKEGVLCVTVPNRTSKRDLARCIEEMLPKLKTLVQKHKTLTPDISFYDGFSYSSQRFSLSIVCADVKRPFARLLNGQLTITCRQGQNFNDPEFKQWIIKIIEKSLCYEAKKHLPIRLHELSLQHGFTYCDVKVKNTHSRWGSCSMRRSINLSCYLLLLPTHLCDYVMLHELCHTVEMNHGPRFWDLMNSLTGNKAKLLRAEMKTYDTTIFSFLNRS